MPPVNVTPYDYIFAGAGLAGLTLATEMAERPAFRNRRMLLIDRDDKTRNDRTWCFWASESEPLPPVVFQRWEKCHFYSPGFASLLDFSPYRYHMIRGSDFYQWAKSRLASHAGIDLVRADVLQIDAQNGTVDTSAGRFQGDMVFNSALVKKELVPSQNALFPSPFSVSGSAKALNAIYLLQHFKGWVVRAKQAAFDPEHPTFMDFRVSQQGETRFVYVLPFSVTEALVEFTVFSPALLPPDAYDEALAVYLRQYLQLHDFTVVEEEFGVIPMTDWSFGPRREGRVFHIGTAGGFVKASSGYAFLRTQRRLRAFLDHWEQTGRPDESLLRSQKRFRILDSIFLRVLADRGELGHDVFRRLFQRLPAPTVLRFLDEDATFADILRVVSAPPVLPFLVAAFRQIPRYYQV